MPLGDLGARVDPAAERATAVRSQALHRLREAVLRDQAVESVDVPSLAERAQQIIEFDLFSLSRGLALRGAEIWPLRRRRRRDDRVSEFSGDDVHVRVSVL